jgi:uncharacterized membrane protein YqiK
MALFVMLLLGIAAIGAAVAAPPDTLPGSSRVVLGIFGVLDLSACAVMAVVTRLYQKASANRAFVRTGQGGDKVILDAGALVVPVLHNIIPVSLESMRLNVERRGPHALITRDNLRVDLSAEFYIKVQPSREDILQAARSLGGRSVTPGAVGELVQEKLVSALRTVAARMDLFELHAKRDEFAAEVQKIVTHELGANGLTLETVTISSLDQTDTASLREANVFDAQGLRKIAQITQEARVERNRIEREAEQNVVAKNVETRKKVLEMERDQAEFEAEQKMKVSNISAAREREIQEFRIAQEEAVARREIEKKQAVGTAQLVQEEAVARREVEKKQALGTAEVQRALAVEQAEIDKMTSLVAKQRDWETAEIEKTKSVEVANREKEAAVARKEAERAAAQAQMHGADAEREAAKQKVLTVQVTGEADREAAKQLIAARQAIEQDKVRKETAADVAAYSKVREAEAGRKAADLEYEAKLRLAEGDAQSAMRRSEGDKAQKMVDVEVERQRVDVERVRVEVERQSLSNKQEFEEAALRFELEKLRIEAEKAVRIETAESLGQMMHGANVQIFGDPATMTRMMHSFMRAAGVGASAEGLLASLPPEVRALLGRFGIPLGDRHSGGAKRNGAAREEAPPGDAGKAAGAGGEIVKAEPAPPKDGASPA